MPRYSVDRRKRSSGFQWCILRDGVEVYPVATYLQAFRIVQISNQNAELTPQRIADLQAATLGESLRVEHLGRVRTAIQNKQFKNDG